MSSFQEFKNSIGCQVNELEKITGYTRQGLHYTFSMIDEGKMPNRKFLNCIDTVIQKKLQEEIERHETRMNELKQLQVRYGTALESGKVLFLAK